MSAFDKIKKGLEEAISYERGELETDIRELQEQSENKE